MDDAINRFAIKLAVASLKGKKLLVDGEEYVDHKAVTEDLTRRGISLSKIQVVLDDDEFFSLRIKS
jgi:hypothetical protein